MTASAPASLGTSGDAPLGCAVAQTDAEGRATRWAFDDLGRAVSRTLALGQTETMAYDAAGNLIQHTGSTDNDYLFAGEQFDPGLNHYYLRARYMDPRLGRFTTADPFPGAISRPISLHKYQYADLDPVNNTDPTGNFTLAGVNVSLSVRTTLSRVALPSFQFAIRRAVTAVMQISRSGARFVVSEVRRCIRTPSRCRIQIPTISTGFNIPETSQHILDAQLGRGTSLVPSPALLARRNITGTSRSVRRWYNATPDCNPAARAAFRASRGITGGCDEYPYFSALPGGPLFYPAVVSLRLLSNSESSPQGRQINAFYTTCGVARVGPVSRRLFLSFAVPALPNLQWCGTRGRR